MKKTEALSENELNKVFSTVFRKSTDHAGFYFWDFGNQIDSQGLRNFMIELKNGLSKLSELHFKKRLNYKSLGRSNHQNSSKPHRDTAEEHSFLMIAYEPSNVDSEVFVSDYSKYLEEHEISIKDFFGNEEGINLVDTTQLTKQYISELKPFNNNNYRLLLINNSKSFEEKTYGLFHSAEIPEMKNGEDRVLNYMMMHLCDTDVEEEYKENAIHTFVYSDKIDR